MKLPYLKPKQLFLIDSLGACVTALFLLAIKIFFNGYFQVPENVLSLLILIAIILCFYSLSCYLFINDYGKSFIKVIILANLGYCTTTALAMIYYFESISLLAVFYFGIEIIIVFTLVLVEIKTLRMQK